MIIIATQYDYKWLVRRTLTHGSVDQIEFEELHQLTHPLDFKLESFLESPIEDDLFTEVPTFHYKKFNIVKNKFLKNQKFYSNV